jgi:CelD/BcsL family acetyltransferase involved in cellulose biosynthesis
MTAVAEPTPPTFAVQQVSDLASIRAEWTHLAEQCGNVFGTWEWADSWSRHLATDAQLSIGVVRDAADAPIAILPLCVTREQPFRLVRFIGAGPSDQLGPVCAPEHLPVAVAALTSQVEELLGASGIFLGERLAGEEHVAPALGGVPVRRAASPVLPVAGRTFDEFLHDRSRNFRSQVRRRMRKAAKQGFRFRLTDTGPALERDIRTLIRLHEARWSQGASTVFSGNDADFHVDFARHALEHGWLRLWMMEREGTPVAAWYGLRYGNVESYYQAGRDPAYEELNVGFVLLCHSIKSAFDDGVSEYRFGSGDEEYKNRFAEYDPGLETVAISRGARGQLALVVLRTALRAPKRVQRIARRIG